MASAELKDLYKKAIEEVNDLKEKPSNEEQLEVCCDSLIPWVHAEG